MGFLKCEKCGRYYKLREGESIDDFEGCSCGGKFKYVKSLDESNLINDKQENFRESYICPNCGTQNDNNTKFCGSCGTSLKATIGQNKKQSKSEKPFFCPNCGTENIRTDKDCKSCGKPLNVTTTDPKLNSNIRDKSSKYRNRRNYAILGLSIVAIALIVFLISWLPTNIFTNHYDDNYISFDYPATWNVSVDKNHTASMFNTTNYGDIVDIGGGNYPDTNGYMIYIGVKSSKESIQVPINQIVNQTIGLDSNGNNIVGPVNVSTGNFTNETLNVLQQQISNYTDLNGQPNKITKNGLTYYEFGNETGNNYEGSATIYRTLIAKEGLPYFFYITVVLQGTNGDHYYGEGYNGYEKIVNSFKIG